MKLHRLFSLLGILFLLAHPAHALFEVRAGYGAQLSSMATDNINGLPTNPSLPGVIGPSVDGIISLPLVPVGFGLRWEDMGASVGAGAVNFEAKMTRVSALVNYRLIDTIVHLGLIASIGVSHTASATVGSTAYTSSPGLAGTYSIGLEGNLSLLGLIVGAEAGYMAANLGTMKDSGGTSIGRDIDLSGPYTKILVGFGF